MGKGMTLLSENRGTEEYTYPGLTIRNIPTQSANAATVQHARMLAQMTPFPKDEKVVPPPDYDSLIHHDDGVPSGGRTSSEQATGEAGPSDYATRPLVEPIFGDAVTANYRLSLDFHYDSTGPLPSTNLVMRETTTGREFYHAKVSEWNWANPDVVLRRGTRAGEVVGSAEFRWGRDVTMRMGGRGIKGDPEGVTGNTIMSNDSRWMRHNTYTLPMPRSASSSVATAKEKDTHTAGRGRTLILTRTQSDKDGIVNVQQKLAFQNYKVQDATTGKVLAMWTERRIIDVVIKGTLRLVTLDRASDMAGPISPGEAVMMDGAWERDVVEEDALSHEEVDCLVLAFASLAEKTRRRRE